MQSDAEVQTAEQFLRRAGQRCSRVQIAEAVFTARSADTASVTIG